MARKVIINCNYCNSRFQASSDDACITLHPNLGYSRFDVSIKCPHCRKKLKVTETPEAHKWLDERFRNKDYVVAKQTAVEEAVYEATTERGV